MRKAYSYIRMSTDKQLHGDSLRRQLQLSEDYAKENGLQIIDEIDGIPFKDIGISGYKGENSNKGVLSIFITLLNESKIEKNSVLLIESLDRLSRDTISNALTQFLNIVQHGIEIVTLTDNQIYTKQRIDENVGSLFVSLGIMFRANEESAIKSRRLSASWENKRNNAIKKPLTKIAPAWLMVSPVTGKFEVIPDRVKIVQLIFEMCANTCGLWAITKYLNENKVPVFGKSKSWNRSYVKKILSNRSVLGEFQPHSSKLGTRQPIGELIHNYFPRIISDHDFNLATASIRLRTVNSAGRKGKSFSNLFAGLVECGTCGSKMSLRNRGNTPKGGKTLICNDKLMGVGCTMPELKLAPFEAVMFKHLREINFSELLGSESESTNIENEILALNVTLLGNENLIARIIELSISSEVNESVQKLYRERLNKLTEDKLIIEGKIKEKKHTLDEIALQTKIYNGNELKAFLDVLVEKKDDYFFRSSLNNFLKKAITKIQLVEEQNLAAPEDDEDTSDYINKNQLRIKVIYQSSIIRTVLVGNDISMITSSQLKQTQKTTLLN